MTLLPQTGLHASGYNLILADDCWLAETRDATTGELRADPSRFPGGMQPLISRAHELNLKFGLYAAAGTLTCRGYPGSQGKLRLLLKRLLNPLQGHEDLDAATFAKWWGKPHPGHPYLPKRAL